MAPFTAVDEGPDWGIAGTPRPHNRAFAFCRSGPVRLAAAHHPKNCHSGDDRLGTRVTYYGSRPLHDLDRRTCQFPRWWNRALLSRLWHQSDHTPVLPVDL